MAESSWMLSFGIFLGGVLGGYIARATVLALLKHWRESEAKPAEIVLTAVRWPSHLWVLAFSGLIALQVTPLPEDLEQALERLLVSVLLLSMTLKAASLVAGTVRHYAGEWVPHLTLAATDLAQTAARWTVLTIGLLIVLGTAGVHIGPLLGALGVGAIAVGLALQPTLSNLLAGIHVATTLQVRLGNRIKLASGEEGYVSDITWRTTTLRTPANHLIIIPNSRLAESIVTNYNLPDPPVNVVIPVNVSYASDTREVERVLRDEARKIRDEHPQFVNEFEPIVRFQALSDFSINYLVILRVKTYDDQFAVWGELHHRIVARLRQEAIEIPFPIRTVYLREEGGPRPSS
jgi:small-conductance mechanosensitive channel